MRSFYACILIAPTLFLMSCSSSNSFEQHTAVATTQPMAPRAFLILETRRGQLFRPTRGSMLTAIFGSLADTAQPLAQTAT